MNRGDVYWALLRGAAGRRPVVILTRSAAIPFRTRVTVAAVTTRIRSIRTEVRLGAKEGLDRPSVVNCDEMATIPKAWLGDPIGALGPGRLKALNRALRYALGID